MVEKKRSTKTSQTSRKSAESTTSKVENKTKVAKAPEIIEVKAEVKAEAICKDRNCPIHGKNKTRGRIFEGKIIKAKIAKTVTVEWPRRYYLSKYERFEKRRSRVKAHNPLCISAKEGDIVRISECRPLSKSKNFVVMEVIKT